MTDNTNKADIAAIQEVIQLYFDGTHTSDGSKMEQAFAEGVQIIGKTKRMERNDWIEAVRKRESPASKGAPYDFKIKSLHVEGGVAVAVLHSPINAMVFTDVATLLKGDDGRWRIVSKVFYRHPDA